MRKFRILRDIFFIFTVSFTSIILFTMLAGAEYNNELIRVVLLISVVYAVMALVLFSEKISSKPWFILAQVVYVLMLNVMYIVIVHMAGWDFSVKGYIMNAIYSVVVFCIVKAFIFSLDKMEANRINEMLQKHKNREKK